MREKMLKKTAFVQPGLLAGLLLFASFFCLANVKAQNSNLKEVIVVGTVYDETDAPLQKVTIKSNGKVKGMTDVKGKFTVKTFLLDTLVFSTVGYSDHSEVIFNAGTLNVKLKGMANTIGETVVTSFGKKQNKQLLISAVESVKPDELRTPASSLSASLGGKLAGVISVQRTGAPGEDGAEFYIRGVATYGDARQPLILLDGIQISSSDLNSLSPEIIESFSILKDATATAIYGSRGANGVMLITTKLGKQMDRPKLNIRMQTQISMPTRVQRFVDGPKFMEMYNESLDLQNNYQQLIDGSWIRNVSNNRGIVGDANYYSYEKMQGTKNGLNKFIYPNVNWYDELFKPSTINQEVNLNIQGGGTKAGYFMSVTALNSNGILKESNINTFNRNINFKRYSFQNNINVDMTPTTKINLRLNTQLKYYDGPVVGAQDVFAKTINANPVDFPVIWNNSYDVGWNKVRFGTTGSTGGSDVAYNGGVINPLAYMVKGVKSDFTSIVIANLEGEQKLDFITRGLVFKALVSFRNESSTTKQRVSGYRHEILSGYEVSPTGEYNISTLPVYGAGISEAERLANVEPYLKPSTGSSGNRDIYFQPSLEYTKTIKKHNVSTMLVYTQDEYNENSPTVVYDGAFTYQEYAKRRHGLGMRTTYTFDNKYMFEVNIGYNGSEAFAPQNRYGFFPSFTGGWIVSREKFFQPLLGVIGTMKLRANWGLAGNDGISQRFAYLPKISKNGAPYYTTGLNSQVSGTGPYIQQFPSPTLTWEVGEKTNLGIDLTILRAINLSIDIHSEKRKNIFGNLDDIIPTYFGTAGVTTWANVGEVHNKGVEVSFQMNKKFNKTFGLFTRATFTYASNKIVKYHKAINVDYPHTSKVGTSVNELRGYLFDRLFIDKADALNSPLQDFGQGVSGVNKHLSAGDIKYVNYTKNMGLDTSNLINEFDQVPLGRPYIPEIMFGLTNTIQYKRWELSFMFSGGLKTSFFMSGFEPFRGSNSAVNRNVLQFIADDYYGVNNPNIYAKHPRLASRPEIVSNNMQSSSYWLRNGDFIKLRTAEIGYSFKRIGRVFVNGYNLLTFSEFKLWDPEQGGGSGLSYPTQKIFNLGFQLTFQ